MSAKWFDRLGQCSGPRCTRAAVGIVRGESNEEIGKFCERCSEARIKHDQEVKADWARAKQKIKNDGRKGWP